jgi:hypothetical protein
MPVLVKKSNWKSAPTAPSVTGAIPTISENLTTRIVSNDALSSIVLETVGFSNGMVKNGQKPNPR